MEKLIIVSADGHIGPPVKDYEPYLDPKYRHLMPELLEDEANLALVLGAGPDLKTPERVQAIDPRNRILGGGYEDGGANVTRRLEELDAEGIAAEVVLPGSAWTGTPFFYQFNRIWPDDVRMAGVRAYHRWLADAMVPAKGRLLCTADPGPALDINEAIAEARFCAEHGFRGIYAPGQLKVAGAPPIYDPHYERFWAACSDMNLVLTAHAGYGGEQGPFLEILKEVRAAAARAGTGSQDEWGKVMGMMDEENPNSMFAMSFRPRQLVWQLIFSGLFDRYPNLKMQLAECRADWVPELKVQMNRRYVLAKDRPKLKMRPSEYFGRNVFITPSSPRRMEVELRHDIGVDAFMFAADFPHPESTWPNTLNWLQATFYDVPEAELRAILGENAIRAYGLDRDELAKIAARIGPSPSDILGAPKLDERIIADFDVRANFSSEPRVLDPRDLERRVGNDLAAAAAAAA